MSYSNDDPSADGMAVEAYSHGKDAADMLRAGVCREDMAPIPLVDGHQFAHEVAPGWVDTVGMW